MREVYLGEMGESGAALWQLVASQSTASGRPAGRVINPADPADKGCGFRRLNQPALIPVLV